MRSELGRTVGQLWRGWAGVAFLSGTTNILALSGSIFMLSVYDRVIPSGSVPTLVALGLLCLFAYGLQAFVDATRGMMLSRIGLSTKEALAPRVFDIAVRNAATGQAGRANASKDLDQVQGFLSSAAPTALFDLPWVPLYLSVCFMFHVWVGVFVTASALFLVCLAIAGEWLSRRPSEQSSEASGTRTAFLNTVQSQAETVTALGMAQNLAREWTRHTSDTVKLGERLSDATSITSAISRTTRMVVQSSVLALGAYLVIAGEASGGIMIASSILSARALAPIDLAIANWRSFLGARQSWTRLNTALAQVPEQRIGFVPPRPALSLACEQLAIVNRRGARPTLLDLNFSVVAGSCVAVLGSTGAGKTTLAKALVGLLPPAAGAIRLDGTALAQWPDHERGRFVGYLPQQVTLLSGTIAQNIARFDPEATTETVIRAAQAAGVHDLISRLPQGYSTPLGEGGSGLSGGQTQRIGLARALYGDPFLVVLDEPNSAADAEGDAALLALVRQLRDRGAITVVATHRTGVLSLATHALVLAGGRMQQFGPVGDVLTQLGRQAAADRTHAA